MQNITHRLISAIYRSPTMNTEQEYAFTQIQNGHNIFLTGSAGTGKSYVIDKLRKWCHEHKIDCIISAMTGCAALLIHGRTLHSALGLGIGNKTLTEQLKIVECKPKLYERFIRVKLLVIDEVSMLSAELLEIVDDLYRRIRRCSDRPFGGVQVVLCGDLLQLPPVEGKYCFETPRWNDIIHETCMLHTMVRQTGDPYFQKMLSDIRMGRMTREYLHTMERCKQTEFPPHIKPTILYSTRKDVQSVNQREYNELIMKGAKTQTYNRRCSSYAGEKWAESVGIPEVLELCIGTQVVITYNIDTENGIVNGTRGVVIGLEKQYVQVQLVSGFVISVSYVSQELPDSRLDDEHIDADSISQLSSSLLTTTFIKRNHVVSHIPLMYAWAITIHKSQGMTLDAVLTDLGQTIFVSGQAYTAISRVRNLDSLKVTDVRAQSFRANRKVLAFYEKVRNLYIYDNELEKEDNSNPDNKKALVPPGSEIHNPYLNE